MRKIYWWTTQTKSQDLDTLSIIKLFLNEYGERVILINEGFLKKEIENMYSFVLDRLDRGNFFDIIKNYCNSRFTMSEMRVIGDHTIQEFKNKYNINYE